MMFSRDSVGRQVREFELARPRVCSDSSDSQHVLIIDEFANVH